ncbi:MAG: DMT family transporter [Candidatus Scalindua sp. AMX11]|nr:MAG: DMT family transporter [Candidatus Scalindua sp.]NOG84098.1 DMT family transporter [Planctomycetota bacterium]RZV98989.1 MAG: DMT family transporter [Candidatus Scalindua sp. SCAELEC01]TDE66818.1 MAG: DMT family transporter [Candidatus Scalindua sp. AMX11]GJQ57616.1 MAG: multidrug DMT transporter permease [Candidatus Scalindua sp.]
MNWFAYASLCALSIGTADALTKKALKSNDTYFMAWVRFGFAAPFMATLFPFIEVPQLDSPFFLITFLLLPLDIIALLLYLKAIRISPLSLTLPFLSLTPVFLIGTSYIILGELPDKTGVIGIMLVATGAYLLNVHTVHLGILGPIKAIGKERGSVLMIVVAFLFSITSILGKIAVQHSNPTFFAVFYSFLLSFSLFFIIQFKTKRIVSKIVSQPLLFLFIGICMAIMMLTHLKAISLVEVSYMISVKRMSLLLGVVYGTLFFKERNIKERFLGSATMILGIVLISLF